ncbi:hypothetical protein N7501_006275 [Penicillium viridicatum]|nr:hypothetical protein N7501_006275 [Penicillium viridicatum]
MVKPDIVPVVVLPVLPVQGMRGVANVAGGKKGRNRTVRYGGIEAVLEVFRGEAQLAIATPAQMMSTALTRQRIFAPHGPMPSLRALGVLPQNEPHVLAIDPKYEIESFKDLR